MKDRELLALAALLHDIGKFRMRRPKQKGQHQEHSYQFVTEDFQDFFSPCGGRFSNAIRHHHPDRYPSKRPRQLEHLMEKQVILADRLSAKELAEEDRGGEHYTRSALVSILSRLKCANKEYRYPLMELNIDRDTMIPGESVAVNQDVYNTLWDVFMEAFGKATEGAGYTPAFYQTIVALLHKYTSRIPSATSSGAGEKRSVPDISLYDHLRTTAAIAVCIGRELTEDAIEAQLSREKNPNQEICALIKGDISGIQNFLYQIVSDGASNQLRGRSFYLQLLSEVIAHWVLKQFDLPITNLILASGGHFYILAPHSEAKEKMDMLRKTLSEKLWRLHKDGLSCVLAEISITAGDFESETFPRRWGDVSERGQARKHKKWSEIDAKDMFENFFEPHADKTVDFGFDKLGTMLRDATYLVAFEVPEAQISGNPDWRAALKAFGLDIRLCTETDPKPTAPKGAERVIVYRLGNTDFLKDIEKYQWEGLGVSYDFRMLPQVIAHKTDGSVADYDALANASEGVKWLGALRMDVDDLGTVFIEKLGENATVSRMATLSEALCLFFEGYVPQICREYNREYKAKHEHEILELIYAGGDDLFLVGGWSALPEIAERIRSEFREFVTGDHVTLSGGIAIEHMKFPLYQFAAQSGEAEKVAKSRPEKNAITFLRKPMSWKDFERVRNWHERFLDAVCAHQDPIPHGLLTRLNQIYTDEKRWAWRSIYYFHRLKERYREQTDFLDELRNELNHKTPARLKEFIHVITRWTVLRVRNKEN